jgi:hypothetical protein
MAPRPAPLPARSAAIGTASKWRVRYAKDRLAGFSETGNRGPVPKYGAETGRRMQFE